MARSLEYRSITALAADEAIIEREGPLAPVKNQGTALQQAALDTGSLLPVYGSSELNLLQPYTRPYHPTILFHDRPTGFMIFPVGKAESTCLTILQKLAGLGPALRGRKVAISLSPCWFFTRLTVRPDAYAGNFSELHAGDLVFDTRLSLRLRQDTARRMLQFPATVAKRPLLRLALENLANGSPLSIACYEALLPLGMHAQCDTPLPGSLERGGLSLGAPRENVVPDFAAQRSAAGLADVAPAGRGCVPATFQQQRIRAGKRKVGLHNFARKRSDSETRGRRRLFSEHSRRARNGSIWSFFCAS